MNRRATWAWALYDWANSAFATTVMAGFFPVFFKTVSSVGVSPEMSTARLGFANSLGVLLVALSAPFLGALADSGGYKKRFLGVSAFLGGCLTIGLAFVPSGGWMLSIGLYVAAAVVFAASLCFYDSLLPIVSSREEMDRTSALGFALGYIGGGILFLLNVWMYQDPARFGLADGEAAVRASFVTVGLWWILFTLPVLIAVREEAQNREDRFAVHARQALISLRGTVQQIRTHRAILFFLIAFYFYNDGVGTIMKMATDYGLSIGFGSTHLVQALLLVQFISFPMTLAFGALAKHFRARHLILLCIVLYMGIVIYATQMRSAKEFFILAAGVGCIQGGIQALSRSFYARMIPQTRSAQFFGFYNLMGKFSGLLGPALVGGVGLAAGSTRWGIGSLILIFAIGGWLLSRVPDQERQTP